MEFEITTYSEQETFDLGLKLGRCLKGGEIIALSGELGAGKTCMTKGIARGLDIHDVITSSSFVLASVYLGRLALHHLDFYRLYETGDFYSLGFDDYIGPENIVVIEWAERFIALIPEPYLNVVITIEDDTSRRIRLSVKHDDEQLAHIVSAVQEA